MVLSGKSGNARTKASSAARQGVREASVPYSSGAVPLNPHVGVPGSHSTLVPFAPSGMAPTVIPSLYDLACALKRSDGSIDSASWGTHQLGHKPLVHCDSFMTFSVPSTSAS
eukprot:6119405-Prymnesium_polylepis.2